MMRKFIFFSLLTMVSLGSRAAHIIGGEMYYECLGDNTYEFTMKLYRDCNGTGAPFDEPASFAIFDENNNLVTTFQAFITSIQNVQPDLSSPCLSFPPDICVQEGIYVFTRVLPSNTQAYQVVYQRCCRNGTILNLTNPGSQGLTIVAEVPPADIAECNNRPYFNNFPPPVLCAQEYLEFDHSATDPDGDELIYSLCAPFIGGTQTDPAPNPPSNPPYDPVTWSGTASATNPITSGPQLTIDPVTGLLTGTPTQLGQYVVGVCVEEWRDGQLLSVNTRDFQFNVALCEVTSEAIIAEPEEEDLCEDLTFNFENLSDPSNSFVWDFGVEGISEDVSTAFNPTYTFPDTGTYIVSLITNPGFFCSDTAILELPLYYQTQIQVEISDFECVDGQQIFSFTADGFFDQQQGIVQWDFGPNASPQQATGLTVDGIVFSALGPQEVFVEVVNNACEAQDFVTIVIPEPPEAMIMPQDTFCAGLQYSFSIESENASIYNWDFGVSGTDADQSTLASPAYTFPEPGIYTVSLTASNPENCPITVTETFDINPLLAPEIEPNEIACYENNSISFQAAGSYSANAVFSWQFENASPGASSAENPSGISFIVPGTHPVNLTVSENGCTRSAEGEMIIHDHPIADFIASNITGCAPVTIGFSDRSFTQSSSVLYTYDFGDGNTANARNTSHTYTEPGIYDVSLTVQNLNGCIDVDDTLKTQLILVNPSPTAGFMVDPIVVSAVDPTLSIFDGSTESISCSYFFDGQLFENCDFEHFLQNVEPQTITQTVQNEFGCTDRFEREIFISDHLIYIPNAFTPDQDGLNDIFRPVTTGATNIQMYIYDRWGQEVFGSENVEIGWNGSSPNTDFYAPAGVYQYLIIITDNLGWNFEYKGSVRLLR